VKPATQACGFGGWKLKPPRSPQSVRGAPGPVPIASAAGRPHFSGFDDIIQALVGVPRATERERRVQTAARAPGVACGAGRGGACAAGAAGSWKPAGHGRGGPGPAAAGGAAGGGAAVRAGPEAGVGVRGRESGPL
jgi:hypothetical protein